MEWIAALQGKIVGLDTTPLIYFIEENLTEEAARLRAVHSIRTPDAIQMATAIHEGASFLPTNDAALPSLPGLSVVVLDDLKAQPQAPR